MPASGEPHQVKMKLVDEVMFAWKTRPFDLHGTHGLFILSQTKRIVLRTYPQSFSMHWNIPSNCKLATNGVWCLMLTPHPYPLLRHPPTSWELRLTIVHLGHTCEAKPTTLKRHSPGDGFVSHMCSTKFTIAW